MTFLELIPKFLKQLYTHDIIIHDICHCNQRQCHYAEHMMGIVPSQVECVQNYTVLVGINGAGLMNCIYLPRHSTCIQMTPYKASVNTHQYGLVLKSRGPYLEWENTHENMTRVQPSDKNLTHPDTIVHVQEFIDLIIKALKLSDASMKQNKDEL